MKSNNSNTSISTKTESYPIPSVYIECLEMLREVEAKIRKVYESAPVGMDCLEDDYNDFNNYIDVTAYHLSHMARMELMDNIYYRERDSNQNK